MHPIVRQNRMHSGIDVPAPTGTRLIASAEGYVRFAGWSGGYGNTVIIDHGNGYSTLYAHNSRNRVTTGQFVTRGQHIADVGSTGMSTGPHLHFEIRINNSAINPMRYFPS
jgi:murein DD-endopeptidase MepM/ murein hydrolase activator NlpD